MIVMLISAAINTISSNAQHTFRLLKVILYGFKTVVDVVVTTTATRGLLLSAWFSGTVPISGGAIVPLCRVGLVVIVTTPVPVPVPISVSVSALSTGTGVSARIVVVVLTVSAAIPLYPVGARLLLTI
jgi:hypothetical protein